MKDLNYNKTIIALIAVLTFVKVNAQEIKFGVKAGFNSFKLTEPISNIENIGIYSSGVYGVPSASSRISFHIGGVAELELSDKFSMQLELLYSSQGERNIEEINTVESSGFFGTVTVLSTDLVTKLDYINLPFIFKYKVTKVIFIEAGTNFGLLVSAKQKGMIESTSGFVSNIPIIRSYDDNIKGDLKALDFGVNFGLSFKLQSGLILQSRYNLGLSKITKDDNPVGFTAQNRGLQVSLVKMF